MTNKRFAVHGMQDRLVPRYPTAQASQASHCAEPAAPAHAGAAFHHFTESNVFMQEPRDEAEGQGGAGEHGRAEGSQARLPSDRAENKPCATAVIAGAAFTESCPAAAINGQDQTAPAAEGASSASGAVTLSIELSPAVALILKLATDAAGVDRDELIARAVCVYADRIGIPSLARPADEIGDDLTDVPHFVRRDQMRFSRAREALGNKTRGVLK